MKSLWLILVMAANAGEVVDLGTIEVQGKIRGPEIQLIESNRVGEETAEQMSRWQLKNLEKELLEPELASAREKKPGAGKSGGKRP